MSDSGYRLRTLLVGIDAACLPLLTPQFEAGSLPALRILFEAGASGSLQSHLPPWTPSAWPTLYTGTNPGKHGVFSFLTYDGYDYGVVTADDVREPAVWELLDHHGLSSVVVNVPVTHPVRPFDGALIPGFVGPEDPPCHPPGLLDEVRDAIGDYRVYSPHEFDLDAPDDEQLVATLDLVRMRGAAFRYLVDRFEPDFGFVQFQQTDTVCHDSPGDLDKLHAVYEAVYREVGDVIDAFDPEVVLVASDHGIGPYAGSEFRLNEFLREHGYLTTTREAGGMPSWVPLWRDELSGLERAARSTVSAAATRSVRTRAVAAAATALDRAGLTTDRVVTLLDRFRLTGVVRRVVPTSVVRSATVGEQVDFARSIAYLRLPVELGVRINLAGREPNGLVRPEEYEAVRTELVDLLKGVRTPEGDLVFELVAPREVCFDGPALDDAPDIVTVPAGFEQFPSARLGADLFGPLNEPWNHKFEGVLAVAGEGIDPAGDVTGATLLDVAPTVLATLGVPRSDRMDGDVLPVVDPVGVQSYPTLARRRPDRRPHRDATVESHLTDLGYLD